MDWAGRASGSLASSWVTAGVLATGLEKGFRCAFAKGDFCSLVLLGFIVTCVTTLEKVRDPDTVFSVFCELSTSTLAAART